MIQREHIIKNHVNNDMPVQFPGNKARQDKFFISFELPEPLKYHKNRKFFDEEVKFSCFQVNIPKISVPSKMVPYAGQHLAVSTHTRPEYSPLNLKFNVDTYWKNYLTIYNWLNILNDEAVSYVDAKLLLGDIKAGEVLKKYRTDISIVQLDEYNNPVIEWKYFGAFPTDLAEIDSNQQSPNEIPMSATFSYSQFIPNLLINIE